MKYRTSPDEQEGINVAIESDLEAILEELDSVPLEETVDQVQQEQDANRILTDLLRRRHRVKATREAAYQHECLKQIYRELRSMKRE